MISNSLMQINLLSFLFKKFNIIKGGPPKIYQPVRGGLPKISKKSRGGHQK
jgi:hypothetical protein